MLCWKCSFVMSKKRLENVQGKRERFSYLSLFFQRFFCLFFSCFNNLLGWNLLRRIFVSVAATEWWKMTILPQWFDEYFLFIYVVGRWHAQYVQCLTVYDDKKNDRNTKNKKKIFAMFFSLSETWAFHKSKTITLIFQNDYATTI